MSDDSNIEWTDATWNPTRGCRKVSPGCKNCYAETFAERWRDLPGHPYERGFSPRTVPESLDLPRRWRRGRRIFVNSMSDLFLGDFSDDFIREVWQVMIETPRHTYQILTKRADRLAALAPTLAWPRHIWAGVSVESHHQQARIDALRCVPAAVRFISFEPLIGQISTSLDDIDWCIVGGESGSNARPLHPAWVEALKSEAKRVGAAFFFKQWGRWKPISHMQEQEYRDLYVSRRKARRFENQEAVDESYGRRCIVPELVLRADGQHLPVGDAQAFRSDLPGWPAVHAFALGKRRAGRTFAGAEVCEYPTPAVDRWSA